MNRSVSSESSPRAAWSRRAAHVLTILGVGLVAAATAFAQTPTPASPGTAPVPFSWPNFHAGGVPPAGQFALPNPLPAPNLFSSPYYNMLWGTPSGIANPAERDASGNPYIFPTPNVPIEIPSFALGNYNPATVVNANNDVPRIFGNNYRLIGGPYLPINAFATPVTLDDDGTNITGTGGTVNAVGGWALIDTNNANANLQDVAASATGSEYNRIGVIPSTSNAAPATFTWTLVAPQAGAFSVLVNIPDPSLDPTVESRIPDAHYVIRWVDPAGNNRFIDTRTSQTEAHTPAFLGGPITLGPNNLTVTVTLDNTTQTFSQAPNPNNFFVVADSVTLQAGLGGDVQSSATAVNVTEFPEIQNASYFGAVTEINAAANITDFLAPELNGGAPVFHGTHLGVAPVDNNHKIRQLVYFARAEFRIDTATQVPDPRNPSNLINNPNFGQAIPVGAIYCMDGFTGAIVWRYETPASYTLNTQSNGNAPFGSRNGATASAFSFSTPVVARVNVLVGTEPPPPPGNGALPLYQTRLVVIVGDESGKVYCLDALGNGDGTANSDVLDPTFQQPIYITQPGYNPVVNGAGGRLYTPPTLPAGAIPATVPPGYFHVGTTQEYWVYRPDSTKPKYTTSTGGKTVGAVKLANDRDPNTDLPVPSSYGIASPVVYVDPGAANDETNFRTTLNARDHALVYVGASNGVLYGLDATGQPADLDGIATQNFVPSGGVVPQPNAAAGDPFDASQDVRRRIGQVNPNDPLQNGQPAVDPVVPTCVPAWWFTIGGPIGSQGAKASIQSTPAVLTVPPASNSTADPSTPIVYVTTANEGGANADAGRLYAVNGLTGPVGNSGRPVTGGGTVGPGGLDYNVDQRSLWSFPDRWGTGASTDRRARSPLGDITGSPVVFSIPNNLTGAAANDPNATIPRVYFAANIGAEVPFDGTTGEQPQQTDNGRVWCVNAVDGTAGDGTTVQGGTYAWAYPFALNPNNANVDPNNNKFVPQPQPPIGSFLHATPAMGLVQFPASMLNDAGAQYNHFDAQHTGGNGIRGATVPMLYIGSFGVDTAFQSPVFYALDVDGRVFGNDPTENNPNGTGTVFTNDEEHFIYGQASPFGSGFQSSPALIVNASTRANDGNGGAVFVTAGSTLVEFGATYVDTPPLLPGVTTAPAATGQFFVDESDFSGFAPGPFSSPTVAGADVNDIGNLNVTASATNNVANWVYVGSTQFGQMFGITPFEQGAVGGYLGGILPPVPPIFNPNAAGNTNPSAYPIRTHIFDGTANHPASSTRITGTGTDNIGGENPIGGALPVFEWGQSVYIRFSNVFPPNPPTAGANGSTTGGAPRNGTTQLVEPVDPNTGLPSTDPTVEYGGGEIKFQIDEIDANGNPQNKADNETVPAVVRPRPFGRGFVQRDPGDTVPADEFVVDTAGHRWLGTFRYPIQDGSGRKNTPGAQHRILNVTQTVYIYTLQNGNYVNTGQFTVNSPTTATGRDVRVSGRRYRTLPAGEPTFGILNPIGIRAGGVPLPLSTNTARTAVALGRINGIGPFRGVNPLPTIGGGNFPGAAPTAITTPTTGDFEGLRALANGNNTPTQGAPPNGVQTPVGNPTQARRALARATRTRPNIIITSTGEIPHGTSGDNSDPSSNSANAPVGILNATTVNSNGLGDVLASYGQFTLDIADRSALGLFNNHLRNLKLQREGMRWNDNTGLTFFGPTIGAVVNPLPWDYPPTSYGIFPGTGSHQPNDSTDYPDLPGRALTLNLNTNPNVGSNPNGGNPGDLTTGNAYPDSASGDRGDIAGRSIYLDPTQALISVPKFQPANLQLYDAQRNGPTTPAGDTLSRGPVTPYDPTSSTPFAPSNGLDAANGQNVPMGYGGRQYVYVDSDRRNTLNPGRDGKAYREVYVLTGVPVSMATSIASQTTDLGVLPHGFGIQTDAFTGPGNEGPFDPYNLNYTFNSPAGYQANGAPLGPTTSFFKPLTVYNNGNVNLLNVHFDQKLNEGGPRDTALQMLSDPVDPTAVLPGFDYTGTLSGPVTGNYPGRFLIRTNLDTDLIQSGIGRNPSVLSGANTFPGGVNGQPLRNQYLGATFHKARVGDTTGTVLTVPDIPHDNNPNDQNIGQFALAPPDPAVPPTLNNNNVLINSAGQPTFTTPSVGLAVPLGTPVGTYSQNLRLFEGIDPPSYNANGATNTTALSLLGVPLYGGIPGGQGTPTQVSAFGFGQPGNGHFPDSFQIVNGQPAQPVSEPATTLVARVTETRLTDGFQFGPLPQIDLNPVVGAAGNNNTPTLAPNFLPAVFRDAFWNGGTLRGSGAMALYWTSSSIRTGNATPGTPYDIFGALLPFGAPGTFLPAAANRFWTPIAGLPANLPAGSNTGMSVAHDQELYGVGGADAFTSDGTAFGFWINTRGGGANGGYANTIYAAPLAIGNGAGQLAGPPVPVSADPSQPKYGPRGLKFASGIQFRDPNGAANTNNPVLLPNGATPNLWCFWAGGTRGHTGLFYSAAAASGATLSPWTNASGLALPEGLSAVSDPSAYLVNAPDPATGNPVPMIEVTYSGLGLGGNSDIYVSRYRPYHPLRRDNSGQEEATQTLLAPVPFGGPFGLTEQLSPDATNNWYQARDVSWLRYNLSNPTATFNVYVNGTALLRAPGGFTALFPNIRQSYDRASNTWVFSNVNIGGANGPAAGPFVTIYVDTANGRIRFSRPPINPAINNATRQPIPFAVFATFSPLARRITTDPRADTAPVSFVDETWKANEAGFNNASLPSGTNPIPRVKTDRYWFLWRKAGSNGTSAAPTLYYKTQRLTVVLHTVLASATLNNRPVSIKLNANGQPQALTVTSAAAGTLYDSTNPGVDQADVDWSRGRIYFPMTTLNGVPMEGQNVTVTFLASDGNTYTINDNAHWLDEPRFNDIQNLPGNVQTTTPAASNGILTPSSADTSETAVPIHTVINEGSVAAFLDPYAYANVRGGFLPVSQTITGPQVPKVWLFWTSTRNAVPSGTGGPTGTADLYYETIAPRFAPSTNGR